MVKIYTLSVYKKINYIKKVKRTTAPFSRNTTAILLAGKTKAVH